MRPKEQVLGSEDRTLESYLKSYSSLKNFHCERISKEAKELGPVIEFEIELYNISERICYLLQNYGSYHWWCTPIELENSFRNLEIEYSKELSKYKSWVTQNEASKDIKLKNYLFSDKNFTPLDSQKFQYPPILQPLYESVPSNLPELQVIEPQNFQNCSQQNTVTPSQQTIIPLVSQQENQIISPSISPCSNYSPQLGGDNTNSVTGFLSLAMQNSATFLPPRSSNRGSHLPSDGSQIGTVLPSDFKTPSSSERCSPCTPEHFSIASTDLSYGYNNYLNPYEVPGCCRSISLFPYDGLLAPNTYFCQEGIGQAAWPDKYGYSSPFPQSQFVSISPGLSSPRTHFF